MQTPLAETYAQAAREIAQVLKGRALSPLALSESLTCLRHWYALSDVQVQLLSKKAEPVIEALINVALYELEDSKHDAHTVVNQAVAAATLLKKTSAKSLINAVLRRYLREHPKPRGDTVYNLPPWLLTSWKTEWPKHWQILAEAAMQPAPMYVRLNLKRCFETAFCESLTAQAIAHQILWPGCLYLPKPVPMKSLPGYEQGHVAVQDASAQLAAHLLAPKDGERVLDACAAPGGKAAHLLALADIHLTAIEADPKRHLTLVEQLERMGARDSLTLICADAAKPSEWWDGQQFDRILIDAPCTGTGVLRRHPDGKLLKRASDERLLQAEQLRLLTALWPLLKKGGHLLYVTCSLQAAENRAVKEAFLSTTPDAHALAVVFPPAAWLTESGQCLPLLPSNTELCNNQASPIVGDGLYFARFAKLA